MWQIGRCLSANCHFIEMTTRIKHSPCLSCQLWREFEQDSSSTTVNVELPLKKTFSQHCCVSASGSLAGWLKFGRKFKNCYNQMDSTARRAGFGAETISKITISFVFLASFHVLFRVLDGFSQSFISGNCTSMVFYFFISNRNSCV